MIIDRLFFAMLMVTLLVIAGCQGKQQQSLTTQGSKVLAKVNGVDLTADDITFRRQEGHGNAPQYGEKSIDDIINQELLYQQGLKIGLDRDPDYKARLAKLERMPAGAKRLEMARRVFNTQIAAKIDVTYQDGKDYYERNADKITTELHLEMIKFDKRQEAEEALKKLRGGATFESIARPIMGSSAANGRNPWDLGFVKWADIPVDFVESLYRLKPGEVSDVLGSHRTGFQIAKLVASRKVPRGDYATISATVMNRLRDLRLLESYNQYVAQLKRDATIVKF